jgi:MFS family permease
VRVPRPDLGNRDLLRLQAAWAAAALASWAFTIVLAVYAYEQGGVRAVGVAALVRMLPCALLAPYAGLLGDRHSRRLVLLGCSLVRALVLVGIAGAVAIDASLAVVLALSAVFTAVGTAHKPAQAALVPLLARTPRELAVANVYWSVGDNVGFLLGSLAAGALVGLAGAATGFAACAVPLLVASWLIARLPADERPEPVPGEVAGSVRAELVEGARTVRSDRDLRALTGVYGLDMLVQAMLDVLLVIAAIELLGIGESGVGWLSAAWGVGGIAGGAAAALLLRRGRLALGLTGGAVLVGAALLIAGAWAATGPTFVMLVLVGVGFGLVEPAILTLSQRLASDDVLARVFGVMEVLFVLGTAVGSVAAAELAARVGVQEALIVTGCLLPLAVLPLRRRFGAMEAAAEVPAAAFQVLRSAPAFAPLPVATVETLAVRAERETVPPGGVIIRQGDTGDHYYVVQDGTAEVLIDGTHVAEHGAGKSFGEIALLHDVPRTATVRARTPTTVLAIDRAEFLAAIGLHARSLHAVHAHATERMQGAETVLKV